LIPTKKQDSILKFKIKMAEKRNYSKKPTTPAPIQANEYGKLPPQALELEEAVLGAIMIEKDAYSHISEMLKPECFYKVAHQKIFEAVMLLAVHQEPIDMHTVTEQLRNPQYNFMMTWKQLFLKFSNKIKFFHQYVCSFCVFKRLLGIFNTSDSFYNYF